MESWRMQGVLILPKNSHHPILYREIIENLKKMYKGQNFFLQSCLYSFLTEKNRENFLARWTLPPPFLLIPWFSGFSQRFDLFLVQTLSFFEWILSSVMTR